MIANAKLAPCRLCGSPPRATDRSNAHVVSCGNCGLRVKQSAMGANDAAQRWNALNARMPGVQGDEIAQEVALCEAHRIGLRPGRLYRFAARIGCAKCEAWQLWNDFSRGEGPPPVVGHPLLAGGGCNPEYRVARPDLQPIGANGSATRGFPPEYLERH